MTRLATASAIALGAMLALGTVAQAATVVVTTHRPVVRHHHRHCVIERTVRHRHGRRIVITRRVCR